MHNTILHAAESPLAQYQAFLRAGQLGYQYDTGAGRAVFYPRLVSPYGGPLEWRVSGGLGTVHATTWVPVRDGPAYNVALVEMDEGFRLMSNVVNMPPEEVRIGLRVRVRIVPADEGEHLPVFEAVADREVRA